MQTKLETYDAEWAAVWTEWMEVYMPTLRMIEADDE
jgi:hypothetical protein